MRAAVLVEPGRIEMEERPIPTPGPGDVLIRVSSVGVCGSDTHYYRHGRVGSFVVDAPLVLGHEAAGTIVGVGEGGGPARASVSGCRSNRSGPTPTARRPAAATTTCARTCGSTAPRRSTARSATTSPSVRGSPIRCPTRCPTRPPRLCEPLSVGIAAVRKAGLDGGSRVLIAGAGPIGIVIAQLARAYGATDIVVSDPDESRREQALTIRRDRGARPDRRADRRVGRGRVHRRLRRTAGRRRRHPRGAARPARWCSSARAPSRWSCRRS